jgi:hypothetical protein
MILAPRAARSGTTPWWLGLLACDLGCAPPPPRVPPQWVHPTPAEWLASSSELERLRAEMPGHPYTVLVSTTLRDPRSGHVIDGRGALAVAPGQGLRMILIGAAGATLLDAWVTPSAWRIAVPVASIVRRGGVEAPASLPVGFLRWWFLGRLSGALFASRASYASRAPRVGSGERLWLVRDGAAVVELRLEPCERGAQVVARRRTAATREGEEPARESVVECHASPTPSAGDTVRYADETSGLEVTFAVEGVTSEPPDPAAFRDPDEPSLGDSP